MTASSAFTISSRYCGPPGSANGGYLAGLLAKRLAAAPGVAVEVTLRSPPPLERSLMIVDREGGGCQLFDGETLLAEARLVPADEFELDVPAPPTMAAAERMSEAYSGFQRHPYPTCFVCGPERAEGDGLRIFPGRLAGQDGPVAGLFRPPPSLAVDGMLPTEVLWAALDCPGYFGSQRGHVSALLGRMTAVVHRPVVADAPLIALGFELGRQGRKVMAGTSLHTADGEVVARSRQVWIVPG